MERQLYLRLLQRLELAWFSGQFVLGAETSGADVEPFLLSIYGKCGVLDIRMPFSVRAPFGVAHIVAKLGTFAAKVAFQCIYLL